MKINDENVIKEMQVALNNMKIAYENSSSRISDSYLAKAMGRIETLISVLSVAED